MLVGCTPEVSVPEPEPTDDSAEQTVVEEPATQDDDAAPILSDDEIMASMSCTLLDDAQLGQLQAFGMFDRGARVEVGKVDGVTWWVVVLEQLDGGGTVTSRASFITRSANLDDLSSGAWIELPSEGDTWGNVNWDRDMLVRGQSELVLARETLASS